MPARSRKVTKTTELGSGQMLTSDLKFTRYPSPTSLVPIVRNEELVRLRAEARWGTSDLACAKADLDLICTVSGGLAPMAEASIADEMFAELFYNRRYAHVRGQPPLARCRRSSVTRVQARRPAMGSTEE